jgi:FMN phosphatase YigB (HAD superfamily)
MAAAIESIFFDLGDTLVESSSTKTWLAGVKALLSSLKAKGFHLGILSNTGILASRPDILAILPTDFALATFEPGLVIFSSEVGVEKPKPAIFQLAVTRSGRPAETCLYVSESIVETMVAQHVGMISVRIRTGSDDLASLVAILKAYNLAIV